MYEIKFFKIMNLNVELHKDFLFFRIYMKSVSWVKKDLMIFLRLIQKEKNCFKKQWRRTKVKNGMRGKNWPRRKLVSFLFPIDDPSAIFEANLFFISRVKLYYVWLWQDEEIHKINIKSQLKLLIFNIKIAHQNLENYIHSEWEV